MPIHENNTFCIPYQGKPPIVGTYDTPATAMPRGIGVYKNGTTILESDSGTIPEGFLNTEVTTDGPDYEELMHISTDSVIIHENKVSEGKVQVYAYSPGDYYVMRGNVKSGTTFAAGEIVYMAADGEFTDDAVADVGDIKLGIVTEIGVTFEGVTDCIVWQAVAGLGTKTA